MNAAARRPPLHPIETIVAMLGGRAEALARELLPGGRRDGHEWRCGSVAGEPGTSMAVHLGGSKAGVWSDFASGERGDALDLVAVVLFGGDLKRALPWARAWLGLDNADPGAMAVQRREAAVRVERDAEDAEATRRRAQAMWLGAQPQIAGTPVEYYLAGRGIDLASLDRQPRALRFHPALMCKEAGERLPAMVAAVAGPTGAFVACHRTWLQEAGPGDWRKARLTLPKKVMGRFGGGAIRLWRGATGKAWADAPEDEVLDVTEGIEDGLSVVLACPERRVVASVSLSNMGAMVLPPRVRRVCLWRQNDHQPDAVAAFERVLAAYAARGVDVVLPPIPAGFKDANELLVGKHA